VRELEGLAVNPAAPTALLLRLLEPAYAAANPAPPVPLMEELMARPVTG
jgi:hypothetical protein